MKFVKQKKKKTIKLSFKNIYIGRVSYHLAKRITTRSYLYFARFGIYFNL